MTSVVLLNLQQLKPIKSNNNNTNLALMYY